MVRQAPVICVMAPPIHLGAWSMALMLWLPFELLLLQTCNSCVLNVLVGIPLRQSFIVIGIITSQ